MPEETNTKHQHIVKLTGLAILLEDRTTSLSHLINNTKEIAVLAPSYITVLSKNILPAIELLESAIEDIEGIAAVIKAEESVEDSGRII